MSGPTDSQEFRGFGSHSVLSLVALTVRHYEIDIENKSSLNIPEFRLKWCLDSSHKTYHSPLRKKLKFMAEYDINYKRPVRVFLRFSMRFFLPWQVK